MLELKASIREGGQRDPIEVYPDRDGNYQLKVGWRRLEALRQLHRSEGGDRFSCVLARISEEPQSRVWLFRQMVEENLIREDLSFAEMAQVAINMADDPAIDEVDAREVVGLVYGSLNKTKRSYIRSFVALLKTVGRSLQWPKSVARNIGVGTARVMASEPSTVAALKKALSACNSVADQDKVLKRYVASGGKLDAASGDKAFEMVKANYGDMSASARGRECRVVWAHGFDEVSGDKLEQAIAAFRAVLAE
jgi:ParB family chromosome partitioning protein